MKFPWANITIFWKKDISLILSKIEWCILWRIDARGLLEVEIRKSMWDIKCDIHVITISNWTIIDSQNPHKKCFISSLFEFHASFNSLIVVNMRTSQEFHNYVELIVACTSFDLIPLGISGKIYLKSP